MIDLGEWSREDPDGSITVQNGRVSWVKADRTTVRYVGKETNIIDDFQHCFVVRIDEGHVEDELNRGLLRLWELRHDEDNLVWINARKTVGGWTIHYQQRHQGRILWVYDGMEPLTWGTRYTVRLQRTGNQYRLRVLNEETNALHVDTGEIQGVNQPSHWIRVTSTIRSRRNNGNWSTGYIENLRMTPDHKP
jgi:hypothetical protein